MHNSKTIIPETHISSYNLAGTAVFFYQYDITVHKIEIKNDLAPLIDIRADQPLTNFTHQSFSHSAGQISEVNKIFLLEEIYQIFFAYMQITLSGFNIEVT